MTYMPLVMAHRTVGLTAMRCSIAASTSGALSARRAASTSARAAREVAQDGRSELVDAVVGDAGGQAVLEGGGSGASRPPMLKPSSPTRSVVDLGAGYGPSPTRG